MPGGAPQAWPLVKDILQSIAAKLPDGTPCCAWIGPGGAGHFVKTVHNGIEYGDMQLISEAYSLLKRQERLSSEAIHRTFNDWNRGELNSFLIEITARIVNFKEKDGGYLLDRILDVAGQKGTGKWSAIAAMDENDPLTLIRSRLRPDALGAQITARTGFIPVSAVSRRYPQNGQRSDSRRTLCSQAGFVRTGVFAAAPSIAAIRLATRLRHYRPNLAGRMHHPLGIPQ